jgi:hypothetical protein
MGCDPAKFFQKFIDTCVTHYYNDHILKQTGAVMADLDHMAFLKQAQDWADVWGDGAWFHQVYTSAREHHGVLESAECALRAQDLLRDFMFTHYPDRLVSGIG